MVKNQVSKWLLASFHSISMIFACWSLINYTAGISYLRVALAGGEFFGRLIFALFLFVIFMFGQVRI